MHDMPPKESLAMRPDSKRRKQQKRRTEYKRNVKHYNDRKNRQATRQAIHREDFDSLSLMDQAKREDVWSWD